MAYPCYNLDGKTAVVTGAGGAIGGAIAEALAAAGACVAVWDICEAAREARTENINAVGRRAIAVACDVTDRTAVEGAAAQTLDALGTIDILVNAAGGSRRAGTTAPDLPFFEITPPGLMDTLALNYTGTVLPCQVIARTFAERNRGVILNVASIGGHRPLTRAVAYSTAKAAVINFTQWLAVHTAQEYAPQIRVNALSPGFVLTEQNRFLLTDPETGKPTDRGRRIIEQVPMRRYGQAEEMIVGALWLVSDAASFVTGAVVPIDGGLLASLGV